MPPAVAAAGIVAAGTIGGAVLGGSAQKKAASSAAASGQQATQAQLQLGRESMALNKDIYNSNYNLLSPFVSRGNVAGESINALLGLPTAPAMTSPLSTSGVQTNPVVSRTPLAREDLGYSGPLQDSQRNPAYRLARVLTGTAHPQQDAPVATPAPTPTTTPATNALSPQQAFQNFANSAGMQFQLQQGENAINNGYAARGQLQSGAALKALQDYGQQTALNNYFMPYMGLLGGQQSVGAGAASSVAGVGQNFGNTAAAINGQMGGAIQNGADATANAALLRGQAQANMYGQIGGALGGLASSFFPTAPRY